MGCSCGPLAGNISRNCTSAGWSDIFPNISSVCGSNTGQDKVRASPHHRRRFQRPLKAWKWRRLQCWMLIKTVCWRGIGSLEGRGVEQCETSLMEVAVTWFWGQREKLVLQKTSVSLPWKSPTISLMCGVSQDHGGCLCFLLRCFIYLLAGGMFGLV